MTETLFTIMVDYGYGPHFVTKKDGTKFFSKAGMRNKVNRLRSNKDKSMKISVAEHQLVTIKVQEIIR